MDAEFGAINGEARYVEMRVRLEDERERVEDVNEKWVEVVSWLCS